ncbi:hypothetical protein NDU88_002516 [Pleurodeles waltl]|uniref:Uncharacterized protein n=1 Tax=Pleurodeles waltl TaxID=8319 RepID=A0AAV7SDG3_PLEWA|nr:hypothetical protein NDU88_002516 [Pleurodeles waltl]
MTTETQSTDRGGVHPKDAEGSRCRGEENHGHSSLREGSAVRQEHRVEGIRNHQDVTANPDEPPETWFEEWWTPPEEAFCRCGSAGEWLGKGNVRHSGGLVTRSNVRRKENEPSKRKLLHNMKLEFVFISGFVLAQEL